MCEWNTVLSVCSRTLEKMDEALDKVVCNKFMGKIPIYELHPKDGLYNFTLKDIEFSFNLSY